MRGVAIFARRKMLGLNAMEEQVCRVYGIGHIRSYTRLGRRLAEMTKVEVLAARKTELSLVGPKKDSLLFGKPDGKNRIHNWLSLMRKTPKTVDKSNSMNCRDHAKNKSATTFDTRSLDPNHSRNKHRFLNYGWKKNANTHKSVANERES